MNIGLASTLLRGNWAIDPVFALNSIGMVADILNGNIQVSRQEIEPFSFHKLSSPSLMSFPHGEPEAQGSSAVASNSLSQQNTEERYIVVSRFTGPLMKDDQECGPMGMESMGRKLQQLDDNPQIAGHVLVFDTPGGTVDGTEQLGKIIKNLKKPSLGYVSGLCASAGLWLYSNTNYKWASSDLDHVGSVGVLLSFADLQPMYERNGAKFHTITSSLSPDKTKIWDDLRAGKYEEYRERFLDPVAVRFQDVVLANYGDKVNKEEHLTGKMFLVQDVLDGFVDTVGTLEEAIEFLKDEIDRTSFSSGQGVGASVALTPSVTGGDDPKLEENNNLLKLDIMYTKLKALLGIEELAVVDGFSTLSTDHLDLIEEALASAALSVQEGEVGTSAALSDQEGEVGTSAALSVQEDADTSSATGGLLSVQEEVEGEDGVVTASLEEAEYGVGTSSATGESLSVQEGLNEQLVELQTRVDALIAANTLLQEEVTRLKGGPAEDPAVVTPATDPETDDGIVTAVKPGMTIQEQMAAVKEKYNL